MKYILTSEKFPGEIIFEFDADDRLCHFSNHAQLTEEQWLFLMRRMPAHSEWVHQNFKSDTMRIQQVSAELTFDGFWNAYKYKVGDKTKACKLWEAMSEKDKIMAMSYIAHYDGQLAMSTVAKLYPERYLKQKRWNN